MTHTFSRIMAVATAGYAVYALVKPRHLGAIVTEDTRQQEAYDDLARIFGVRDLMTSALVLAGPTPEVRDAGMIARVVQDVGDGVLLGRSATTAEATKKLAVVTGSWAALNLVALLVDRAREGR
jgi:hypothetical protein